MLAKIVSKYPRKHRDLAGTLDDAVEALEEFQEIEWPPVQSSQSVLESVPSWMDGGAAVVIIFVAGRSGGGGR